MYFIGRKQNQDIAECASARKKEEGKEGVVI
jgi:hypothetical protein